MDIILDLDQTFEKWCGASSGLVLIAYKPETTLQDLQKLDLFSTILSGGSNQNLQKLFSIPETQISANLLVFS